MDRFELYLVVSIHDLLQRLLAAAVIILLQAGWFVKGFYPELAVAREFDNRQAVLRCLW